MNVPQVFRLVYGRLGIQEFLVVYTVVHKCIDGEIPYTEGRQVLEEMGSLTGVYTVIRQSGFHNDAGGADVRPLHGDAKPGVTTSPASGTDEDIVTPFVQELLMVENNLIFRQLSIPENTSFGGEANDLCDV